MILSPYRLLSLIVFLPLLGAIALQLLPERARAASRGVAALVVGATLALALYMAATFKAGTFHYQFGESVPWIPRYGVSYLVGVDGISLWLVVLTALLGLAGILVASPRSGDARGHYALLLALTTTMLGTFVALDLVLFYTFFELSLVPVALLILRARDPRADDERRAADAAPTPEEADALRAAAEGHRAAKRKAATGYFAALFAGSILMLVGMVTLAGLHSSATGRPSFSLLDLQALAASGRLWRGSGAGLQPWVFWAFALAFLVKAPALPFHSWLPGTYKESPIAPLVASVVLKVGTYGLFRFCLPLFPESVQTQLPLLTILGTAGILYGAAIAITQRGAQRLLAFSTVSHVGFILIGLFSLTHSGLMGAAFQQTNHGLTAGALLVLLALLRRRRDTDDADAFGGLKRTMPVFAALFFVSLLGNLGLPGTSGFVGEFLTMLGAFEAGLAGTYGLSLPAAVLAGLGTVLAAGYLLYLFQRMFTGPTTADTDRRDLAPGETLLAGAFAALILFAGLAPNVFTRPMVASVEAARMMAALPEGERPVWTDTDGEVVVAPNASSSALVTLADRPAAAIGDPVPAGLAPRAALPLHPAARETVARGSESQKVAQN